MADLQIFHMAAVGADLKSAALVKMDYMEPIDDPTPCFYVWTIHENGENLHAILHMFIYERRVAMKIDGNDENDCEVNHLEVSRLLSIWKNAFSKSIFNKFICKSIYGRHIWVVQYA